MLTQDPFRLCAPVRRYTGRWLLAAALITAAPSVAAEAVLVRAGRLLDVEQGRYLQDQAIEIRDEHIVSVGPYRGATGAGVRLIDWSAHTVLPGLIDLHTHLIGDISSANIAAPLLRSAAQDTLLGVAHARTTLAAGFTTVRDVGAYRAFVDVALRDAINAGMVDGPRIFVAGAYITVSQGGGEVTGLAPDVVVPAEMRRGVADSADQVRQRVRELLAGGADFIKVIATGAVLAVGTRPSAPEFSEAELRAAVDEAASAGTYVVAHAHSAEGIKRAIRAGVRSVEHASYLDDEGIGLMLRHGAWLVADVYNGDYTEEIGRRDGWPEEILRKNRETTGTQRAAFAKAVRAGVRIGFGTDVGLLPHGENARQFAYMVRHGLTPLGAIRAATIDAAACLGHERDLGSIAPGRFADLIAVDGDPLVDVDTLRAVAAVIKSGRLFTAGGER